MAGQAHIERDKHQAAAAQAVVTSFEKFDRCQVYSPTGSGKSAIGIKVFEALNEPGIMVIVGPTRSVGENAHKMKGYLKARRNKATREFHDPLKVYMGETRELPEIRDYLSQSGTRVICVTNNSLPLVRQALDDLELSADLFVIDEAHRNTALRDEDGPRPVWAENAVISFPARRRLYMTATPRSWEPEEDQPYIVLSQHDETLYGPVAYELLHDDAVKRGIILDFCIYHFNASDAEICEIFEKRDEGWEIDGVKLSARDLLAHTAVHKMRIDGLPDPENHESRYFPQRIMVTFNTKVDAKAFEAVHSKLMANLGIVDGVAYSVIDTTGSQKRDEIKHNIETLCDGTVEYMVVAQVNTLIEGFDLPDLDALVYAAPSQSTIRCIQNVGRVTRNPVLSSKTRASVITCDLIDPEEDPELKMLTGPSSVLVGVLQSAVSLSETFKHELKLAKENEAGKSGPSQRVVPLNDKHALPDGFGQRMSIKALGLPLWSRGDWFWKKFLPRLQEFKGQNGHVRVRSSYCTDDGYPLGDVAHRCRRAMKGTAPTILWTEDMYKSLNDLGFPWVLKDSMDYAGSAFGLYTVIGEAPPDARGSRKVTARCVCGGEAEVWLGTLKRGAKSCRGCVGLVTAPKGQSSYKGVMKVGGTEDAWRLVWKFHGTQVSEPFGTGESAKISAAREYDRIVLRTLKHNPLIIPYLNFPGDHADCADTCGSEDNPKQVRQLLPCGTSAAYSRHRNNGEIPCDACKEAKRAENRERYRNDPEIRNNILARARFLYPANKEERNAINRERYRNDSAYREHKLARARARRAGSKSDSDQNLENA